jgi:hypothetical protein
MMGSSWWEMGKMSGGTLCKQFCVDVFREKDFSQLAQLASLFLPTKQAG